MMEERKIRWGIMGTGFMARTFSADLRLLPDAKIVAVGSRRAETAEAFGSTLNIPHRHASYEALAADPEVDIIYIATPHRPHYDHCRLALEAGKHVLVEKPFTINAAEAEKLVTLARERGLFIMEGMWTRFFPAAGKLLDVLNRGVIGSIEMIRADMSHRIASRRDLPRSLEKADGALLGLGIYPISLAVWLLGLPARVRSLAQLAESGIDKQAACVMTWEGGAIAVLSFSDTTDAPREAVICGSEGVIHLHGRWQQFGGFTVRRGKNEEVYDVGFEGNGYQYQAAEAMRCIRAGLVESPVLPHREIVSIIALLDGMRADWGLRYPGE